MEQGATKTEPWVLGGKQRLLRLRSQVGKAFQESGSYQLGQIFRNWVRWGLKTSNLLQQDRVSWRPWKEQFQAICGREKSLIRVDFQKERQVSIENAITVACLMETSLLWSSIIPLGYCQSGSLEFEFWWCSEWGVKGNTTLFPCIQVQGPGSHLSSPDSEARVFMELWIPQRENGTEELRVFSFHCLLIGMGPSWTQGRMMHG